MKAIWTFLFLSLLTFLLVRCAEEAPPAPRPIEVNENENEGDGPGYPAPGDLPAFNADTIAAIFEHYGLEGTLVIKDRRNEVFVTHNKERAKQPLLPASTYKIMNSLIGIETKAVANVDEYFQWDGEVRGWDKWDQDMNMRNGLRYSCVWFYQELARRIGEEKMQFWLDTCAYGNADISGGIDRFWLDGGLRISAKEQVEFIKKLDQNKLPFSQPTMDAVKHIMVLDSASDYVLRAKTGWAIRGEVQHGWWVGYLERQQNTYYFAINIQMNRDDDAQYRQRILLDVFQNTALLPDTVNWK